MNKALLKTLLFVATAIILFFMVNYLVYEKPVQIIEHKIVNKKHQICIILLLIAVLAVYTVLFIHKQFEVYYIFGGFCLREALDGYMEKSNGYDRETYLNSFLYGGFFLLLLVLAVLIIG